MRMSRRSLLLGGGPVVLGCGGTCRGFTPCVSAESGGRSICSFDRAVQLPNTLQTRAPAAAALEAVRLISECAGLMPNFELVEAELKEKTRAYAAIIDGRRYVVYDGAEFDWNGTGPSWPCITVLAHEIGHHLNGHLLDGGSRPKTELEADTFAGFSVSRLGGSLEDALGVFRTFSIWGSKTHPPRDDRLDAAEAGWRHAEALRLRSPLPCNSEWLGGAVKIDGRRCRMARVCEGGVTAHRLACERAGTWYWQ